MGSMGGFGGDAFADAGDQMVQTKYDEDGNENNKKPETYSVNLDKRNYVPNGDAKTYKVSSPSGQN